MYFKAPPLAMKLSDAPHGVAVPVAMSIFINLDVAWPTVQTVPAAPNSTPEGRQQNRRVELVKR